MRRWRCSAHIPAVFYLFCRLSRKVRFWIQSCLVLISNRVILACIRDFGSHPCPRCYVPKEKLDLVGTFEDARFRQDNPRVLTRPIADAIRKARNYLFTGFSFASQYIEKLLKPKSLVPTLVCMPL